MDNGGHTDILFQNDNGAAAMWTDYRSLGGGSARQLATAPPGTSRSKEDGRARSGVGARKDLLRVRAALQMFNHASGHSRSGD